jgi:hypothetical protein
MEIDLTTTRVASGRISSWRSSFVAALGVIAMGWLSAWLTVLTGLVVALLLRLSFGPAASTLVAAVADAATVLGALLALRSLVAWMSGARSQRGAPPSGSKPPSAPSGVPPAAAGVLVLLLAGVLALPAHAGDGPEPAPVLTRAPSPFRTIRRRAPTSRPTRDRVFLPLPVWLELERKAHLGAGS